MKEKQEVSMKRIQGFLIGVFVTLVLMASIPNFAGAINVVLNSINLSLNGVDVAQINDQFTLDNGKKVPYSIIYDGTTYLPLKKMGQLLGKDILWDGNTRTVSINDLGYQDNTLPRVDFGVNDRLNPAGINEVQNTTFELYSGETFDLNTTLTEVIRGDVAWQMIHAANMFNDPPLPNQEVVLAKFNVLVTGASNNAMQFDLNRYDFIMVSQDGRDYESASYVLPDPKLDSNLYNGASNEGWVAFLVEKTDSRPVIVYGKSYDGTGGVWFKGFND